MYKASESLSLVSTGALYFKVMMEILRLFSITKKCSKCGQELPLECFEKEVRGKYGVRGDCRKCRSVTQKKYHEREDIKEKYRQYELSPKTQEHRKNYRSSKEYKDHLREYHKEYIKREESISYEQSEHRKQLKRIHTKNYYKTEKGKFNIIKAVNRRQRIFDKTKNDLTFEQWESIKKAFDYRCAYCGEKFDKLEKDHIIPISKGGQHIADNIVPACRFCNSKKRAKLLPSKNHKIDLFSGLFVQGRL